MTDLSDVTTDEMFEELQKRNDGIIMAAWQFLGSDKRYGLYTNWHGPKVLLAGLLKQLEREVDLAWQLAEEEAVADDDDDD